MAILLLAVLVPFAGLRAAQLDDAVAVVDRLHRALIEAAASDGDADQRYTMLYPVVTETHDLPYIAQLAVRRYWRGWSDDERDAYVKAFERLSVMTYASRFASVGADSFEIVSSRADGERVDVDALIKRDSADDVTLDYLLRREGDQWRIVNILAEGVSDLALKIDEYGSVLDAGTVEDLIDYIEGQTDALR